MCLVVIVAFLLSEPFCSGIEQDSGRDAALICPCDNLPMANRAYVFEVLQAVIERAGNNG